MPFETSNASPRSGKIIYSVEADSDDPPIAKHAFRKISVSPRSGKIIMCVTGKADSA
jgi:hypothetical protein